MFTRFSKIRRQSVNPLFTERNCHNRHEGYNVIIWNFSSRVVIYFFSAPLSWRLPGDTNKNANSKKSSQRFVNTVICATRSRLGSLTTELLIELEFDNVRSSLLACLIIQWPTKNVCWCNVDKKPRRLRRQNVSNFKTYLIFCQK